MITEVVSTNQHELVLSTNFEKPWLNQNNQSHSDDNLKEISNKWDAETWEKYLKWYETPMKEALISTRVYDFLSDHMAEVVFCNSHNPSIHKQKKSVGAIISSFTPRQKEIIKLTFWGGKTEKEIANELGLSRSTVRNAKKHAISKAQKKFSLIDLVSKQQE